MGFSIAGCRIRVIDANGIECPAMTMGEIVVSGENVMRGYFNKSLTGMAAPLEWLPTGDCGYKDVDGVLSVTGRLDAMINRNGLNVYPEYVVSVLEQCPAVRRAAVGCLPRAFSNDVVVAFVELSEAVAEQTAVAVIRSHIRKHLDSRKHPDDIAIRTAFPLTASGKIHIARLIQDYGNALT